MARPSKRQLACRNANKVRIQKAKERRETGGLALGCSQARDTNGGDSSVRNNGLDGNSRDDGDGEEEEQEEQEQEQEGGGEDGEGEVEDEGEAERQLREKLSGVSTAYITPVPESTPIAPAPPRSALVFEPANFHPNLRYNVPPSIMPPFQYLPNLPPSGSSYSGPSNFFINGPPTTVPQYMAHACPQPNPLLPPLQTFLPQNQSYSPQSHPQQGNALPGPDSTEPPLRIIPEVSNYNYISGKPVCRQTLWRRKKRAEAAALNAVPEPPEPDPVRQHREEMAEAVEKWPRVPTAKLKEDILDAAINDMEKLLKSKVRRPKGQDFNRHQQVLQFMNIQRMNKTGTPRMDLALIVANMYRKGREVADRVVRHEKEWIKRRVIPAGGQGKNAKIPSMLEDEGTIECIRAYIEAMGEKLTAAGLAVAVSAYWQSEKAYEDDVMADAEENGEPPPDSDARKKKLTLSSRTASTWLGKLGYVFEDGVYRYKGVQPVIAPPQQGGAGGYL